MRLEPHLINFFFVDHFCVTFEFQESMDLVCCLSAFQIGTHTHAAPKTLAEAVRALRCTVERSLGIETSGGKRYHPLVYRGVGGTPQFFGYAKKPFFSKKSRIPPHAAVQVDRFNGFEGFQFQHHLVDGMLPHSPELNLILMSLVRVSSIMKQENLPDWSCGILIQSQIAAPDCP